MSGLDLQSLWSEGEDAFVAALGYLFEHSPWVVARAYAQGPFVDADALLAATGTVLALATQEDQLALIRAHPQLAGKAAIAGDLTVSSQREQKSAGLDRLTPEEFERFHALNRVYQERFAFPFIVCARLNDKASILAALEARSSHDEAAEISTALLEISRIARLRLADALSATPLETKA